MPARLLLLASLSPCLLAVPTPAAAADWPQWLGPERDGSTPEKVAAWTGEPKVLWRQPAGEGHSSPVVAGGTVYLHVKVATKDDEALLAFDARTGEKKWEQAYPRG